jgi:hypothetical protein
MRRLSCRSVPTMYSPPSSLTSSFSFSNSSFSAACSASKRVGSLSGSICARATISALPPSKMSVPRPAMLVATVTAPLRPAWATMYASRSCCLAFSTSCGMPIRSSIVWITCDFSTLAVPTSTGCPRSCADLISSITALNLPRSFL